MSTVGASDAAPGDHSGRQPLPIALEVAVVHRIEAHRGGEQAPVGGVMFRQTSALIPPSLPPGWAEKNQGAATEGAMEYANDLGIVVDDGTDLLFAQHRYRHRSAIVGPRPEYAPGGDGRNRGRYRRCSRDWCWRSSLHPPDTDRPPTARRRPLQARQRCGRSGCGAQGQASKP